ncbi:DegT/DnrJ/EryC1/StrS family aminotransferase [Paenibacillus albidus]|uniref:DegT/DnrJ/EryC1/StrS family aminotransferase n=1 Tax=Paenibacillus albidus TaxID=2041023 RepID=UPI001BE5730F|nr:aminotransferase class I/II-fold pyridoxal phosphate-dependent enzyme [Paenibacillus albidus]MBT2291612.1 DegT/DnrJ/EryC1/StrS family aminotransferase [Paenibacillus albidus]
MKRIPFMKPNLVKSETYIELLKEIDHSRIYSNYGKLNTKFEQEIITHIYQGEGYASTVNNATIGLMLAIMMAKRPQGKYAIMPSFTFSATAQVALWCGLQPYFIDVRADDWCMDEKIVAKYIEKLGDDVAVVIPYATFGTVADFSYYQHLLDNGMPVVIDAAASFGSTHNRKGIEQSFGGPIVYSFHATKSFGIGEGGLVYCKNELFIQQLRQAGNFGFSEARESTQMGLNSKLSEYAAAIGLATLKVFNEKCLVRQSIKETYISKMDNLGLFNQGWDYHRTTGEVAHQNVSILCPKGHLAIEIVSMLGEYGVEARTYFSPACHQQSFFAKYPSSDLSVTEEIASRVINLPLWEELVDEEIDYVIEALAAINLVLLGESMHEA